jgi:ATP-dependent RNA helicase DeaD
MQFPALNAALERALAARAYLEATPVQLAVLETEAAGRDLLVSAQTGSGKTVAYGLAMAADLLGEAERFAKAGPPLALVIAPTRELAMQVHTELAWLYRMAGGLVVACVGGMDARREARALAAGCHIVVGTPGRLRDHMDRGQLDVSALRVVVLDEADEMLDLGFREELGAILEATPASRRTLLFSATIAREIAALARTYQRDALRLDMQRGREPHEDIEYQAIRIASHEAEGAVVNVLRFHDARAALVFCATREAVKRLHAGLVARGFGAVALSGELSQAERNNALQAVRDGRARVCVATDVAARGLDLPDLGLVIHAELPTDSAALLHRSGRTGRAGRKGVCVILVPHPRRRRAEMLLASAGVTATWGSAPDAEAIRALDQERLLSDPMLTVRPTESELAKARALLAGSSAEQVATALLRLHAARLPEPADVTAAPSDAPRPVHDKPMREKDDAKSGAMVTFTISVGRRGNADPKWLLPMVCRRGNVTKRDIGAIRIFERESTVDIIEDSATAFMAALAESADDPVRITLATGTTRHRAAPPPHRKGRPFGAAGKKHA